jgi:hypothetical protein
MHAEDGQVLLRHAVRSPPDSGEAECGICQLVRAGATLPKHTAAAAAAAAAVAQHDMSTKCGWHLVIKDSGSS